MVDDSLSNHRCCSLRSWVAFEVATVLDRIDPSFLASLHHLAVCVSERVIVTCSSLCCPFHNCLSFIASRVQLVAAQALPRSTLLSQALQNRTLDSCSNVKDLAKPRTISASIYRWQSATWIRRALRPSDWGESLSSLAGKLNKR